MRPTRARWPTSWWPWPRASIACRAIPRLPGRSTEQRLVLANLTELRLADLDTLAQAEQSGGRTRLVSLALPARSRLAGPFRGHRRQLLQPPANLTAPGRSGSRRDHGLGSRVSCRRASTRHTMLYKWSTRPFMTMSSRSRSATTCFTSRRGAGPGRRVGRASCGSVRPPRS